MRSCFKLKRYEVLNLWSIFILIGLKLNTTLKQINNSKICLYNTNILKPISQQANYGAYFEPCSPEFTKSNLVVGFDSTNGVYTEFAKVSSSLPLD